MLVVSLTRSNVEDSFERPRKEPPRARLLPSTMYMYPQKNEAVFTIESCAFHTPPTILGIPIQDHRGLTGVGRPPNREFTRNSHFTFQRVELILLSVERRTVHCTGTDPKKDPLPRVVADHVGPLALRPIGTSAARHQALSSVRAA